MKNNLTLVVFFLFNTLFYSQELNTIIAKKIPTSESYFNTEVIDNYQWLENNSSEETIEWVSNQNKNSTKFLKKIHRKTNSFNAIKKYTHTKYNYAVKKGDYYFKLSYASSNSRPSLNFKKKFNENFKKLIDPKDISKEDVINIKSFEVSKDSKYLALEYGRNGSDWSEIIIITMADGKIQKDHIEGVKFSNISWLNDGFFYSTFEQSNKFGKPINNKVLYHKLGTQQKEDELILERKNNPLIYFEFSTISDERFFILKEINPEKGTSNIFYIDCKDENKKLKPIYRNISYKLNIIGSKNGRFLALTNKNSKDKMLVSFTPEKPFEWKAISPNFSSEIILEVLTFSDKIVAIYQYDQKPVLVVYNYNGKLLHGYKFPVGYSIGGFSGNENDKEFLFYLQSYTTPRIVFKFNIDTYEKKLVGKTEISFKSKDIVYSRVEYLSKDSTKIPLVLVHKKGIKLDGTNNTILKAYGGFGIVNTPYFDPGIVHFIMKGGVFAFANIRGGGDKGVEWANEGRGEKKQNSFDDFIAGAEYLIKNKYTNSEKLAITGASNGGLVVAVAAIQRPDLFKVVVPVVAPLDMLRFEKFTIGRFHQGEYGTVTDSLSFNRLKNYSPYHNIKDKINYPTMLVLTSDNDDRVPPLHSYKFVAKLQNRKSQINQILLKVGKKSGHYGSSTYISYVREKADVYGFILYNLNKKER